MSGFTRYRIEVFHYDDGDLDVHVFDVGDSEQDRKCVAWVLRQAAKKVEDPRNKAVDIGKLN